MTEQLAIAVTLVVGLGALVYLTRYFRVTESKKPLSLKIDTPQPPRVEVPAVVTRKVKPAPANKATKPRKNHGPRKPKNTSSKK